MCRLLLVTHPDGIAPDCHLTAFRQVAKDSAEYQGHGWGCCWLDSHGAWRFYHAIKPIWEDPQEGFPVTRVFLAHARSAFRNEGIAVENNMPFTDGDRVFLFNGELRGVRIKSPGRIGAEKIFNYIKRFDRGDLAEATARGVAIINKRTRHVRAMNFILANTETIQIYSQFTEDADYFQLRSADHRGARIVCSRDYPLSGTPWRRIKNETACAVSLARSRSTC